MILEALLVWLAIGALVGWVTGIVFHSRRFGLAAHVGVGMAGALTAGLAVARSGAFIDADLLMQVLAASLGSIVLLASVGMWRGH
jgi:uncharacterized membrane protein YeaQ/YmgE (transglycosylase-associated protein family)